MIFYREYLLNKNSEWVVLIHGAGGSGSVWFKQLREYRKHFNVLLVDLRGHGKSISYFTSGKYTFRDVSYDIIEVLDFLKIEKAHFVGISLGTIIIRTIGEMQPERIKSMVLAGAVIRLNFRSRFLMKIIDIVKYFVPFIWVFKIYAYIVIPTKKRKESRDVYVNEGKKIGQKEFLKWLKLTADVSPLLKCFCEKEITAPTLYISGEDDYMFLPQVKNLVKQHKNAVLKIIEKCGHVVNVESPEIFNQCSISFIKNYYC